VNHVQMDLGKIAELRQTVRSAQLFDWFHLTSPDCPGEHHHTVSLSHQLGRFKMAFNSNGELVHRYHRRRCEDFSKFANVVEADMGHCQPGCRKTRRGRDVSPDPDQVRWRNAVELYTIGAPTRARAARPKRHHGIC